jgi:TPR repeat protein
MKNIDLRFGAKLAVLLPLLLNLSVSYATENQTMDTPDAAPASSSSPISGAQSYALTDAQRAELITKAESGDAEAAFRLSLYYTFTSSDDVQRIRWLTIAAKAGHVVAQHNLAYDLYMSGKDLAEAAHWAAESSKSGNAEAGDLLKEIEAARAKARGSRP